MILDELTYEQCIAQGVGPLVFPSRLEKGIDPANSVRMKAVCLQNMQAQVKLSHTLSVAWNALEKAGIKAVLMKGAGLAAFYAEPQMRQWGDVDLYVGTDHYHPACAVLRQTFPDALKFDEELDHYKHYNLIADGISIEVHRVSMGLQHPVDVRRYARMEREGMGHAQGLEIGGLKVRVPESTFNALFVFFHAWEHMMTQGANVRQLCDLKLLLHHEAARIDRVRLERMLSELHLTDVWQLFMYIIVTYLDLPKEEAPLFTTSCAQRAERLLNDLLNGQLVERHATSQAPKGRFARKWHTMQERMMNARRIGQYSPSYARHIVATIWLSGLGRLFAKDRHWE